MNAFSAASQRVVSVEGESDFLDLRALLNMVRRRFWVMAFAATATLLAVILITFQMTPLYTSMSKILIESQESGIVDFDAVMSGLLPDSAIVDTEVQVIRSRALAEAVIDRLDLETIPEFNPDLREPGPVAALVGQARRLMSGSASVPAAPHRDAEELSRERVIQNLMASTAARRVGATYIIEISATSENARLAQEIANTYADVYLDSQLEAKFEATERASDWLNERVTVLRDEVRVAEQAVARYRAEAGLLDAEGSTLTEQQISDLTAQLVIQRAELSEARARLRNVQSRLEQGVSPESIGEVLRSYVIRELRAQQAEVSRRRGELASRYGPRHPQILTVERELADVQTQVDQEVERIVANLESEVDVAQERVASLESSLAGMRNELAANDEALVRLRELDREAEASRALFESFLNRFRETGETEALTDADARIVANAALPTQPSSPKLLLNLSLGVLLAGIAALAAAVLLEVFDNGLRTESDIEKKLGVSHVASVPRLKASMLRRLSGRGVVPVNHVVDRPLSGFAESFRNLRSSISMAGFDKPVSCVAITSALPGEGKTTTSICLGRIAAQASDRVVVIDCDLRRRQLSKTLAPDAEVGMLDVLAGQTSLDAALCSDPMTEMTILPLTHAAFTPRDVFRTAAFRSLLETLKSRFDLVILDTAPVLAVADSRTIATLSDGVVYAAEWGRSAVGSVRLALSALDASKANLIGVVLNNVDLNRQSRYGYGAYYGYQAYRNYYSE